MVAIFTPQRELQELAQRRAGEDPGDPAAFGARHYYPLGRDKGETPLYSGRVRVTMPAGGGQVEFELLDGTYASAGIVQTDEIFIECDDTAIAGSWTVGPVSDPSADVDPLDPPAVIPVVVLDGQESSGSHTTIAPNRVRGRVDTTVDAVISTAIQRETNNRRNRGNTGFSRHSDNLRQLTFQGTVSGQWIIGAIATGGTSGAVGTIVGLGPGINQGLGPDSFGFFIVVDMGLHDPSDPPLTEFDDATPEVVSSSTGASGTLKLGDIGERSTGVLFRPQGNPAYVSGNGIKLFATSGFLEFFDGNKVEFPNPDVQLQNGIYPGDSVQFDDPPVAGEVYAVIGLATGPSGIPGRTNSIVLDPQHGISGGHSQSPVDVLYPGPDKMQETLLATAVQYDATSPSTVLITLADGRTWDGIGVTPGDIIRTKNSGNGNDFDLRAAQFQTVNNPNDRLFLPGDSWIPFAGPYPDTFDVYKLTK